MRWKEHRGENSGADMTALEPVGVEINEQMMIDFTQSIQIVLSSSLWSDQCKNRSTMYPVANAYTALWNTSITCSFNGHVLHKPLINPDNDVREVKDLPRRRANLRRILQRLINPQPNSRKHKIRKEPHYPIRRHDASDSTGQCTLTVMHRMVQP
jgi:hypothetical protein